MNAEGQIRTGEKLMAAFNFVDSLRQYAVGSSADRSLGTTSHHHDHPFVFYNVAPGRETEIRDKVIHAYNAGDAPRLHEHVSDPLFRLHFDIDEDKSDSSHPRSVNIHQFVPKLLRYLHRNIEAPRPADSDRILHGQPPESIHAKVDDPFFCVVLRSVKERYPDGNIRRANFHVRFPWILVTKSLAKTLCSAFLAENSEFRPFLDVNQLGQVCFRGR
ncbi:hypothetical protein KJ807_05590 [Patescibacteria group bacterium]|nr:hypothetical protein [Patescibacteria group bacterium]